MIAAGVPWRTTLAIFGFAALVLLTLPILLFMRRQPEDMGLLPDGDDEPPDANDPRIHQRHRGAEVSVPLKQSLRTKTMWFIACGSLLQTLASGGIAFHMPAYFEESGLSTQIAAAGASVFLLGGALSSTAWGFLAERYDERLLVVGATFTAMVLAVAGRFVSEPIGALVFACLFGATIRGEGALVMMMLAAYFGRGHFGSISGFANTFTMMGLGIGPTLYAWVFDVRGSYHLVFYTSATLLAIATVLMYLARNPYRSQSTAGG
jgi:sugar phosphate permease